MHAAFVTSLAALAVLVPAEGFAQARFVGVRVCAQCHAAGHDGNAVATWQASAHARAFATLAQSTESTPRECGDLKLWIVQMRRGERYGLPTRATEARECLPCHATAFGAGPDRVAATFDRSEGVQCESCHGAGSAHAEAMGAGSKLPDGGGLTRYADERAIERRCRTCHDGTCGTLDFPAMWPRIKHAAGSGR